MTTGIVRLATSGTIALALSLAAPARAGDTEPGVWWEQTIQMEMPGLPMKMPAQKQKICVSKNGMSEPPSASKDERCKATDVKRTGSKMSWKVACTNPTMTGEGEITQGKDSYTGIMSMHSDQGDMTAKMSGKLLGGDCDADATRKQVAAIQKQQEDTKKQIDDAQAQGCEKAIDEVELRLFTSAAAPCKKPDQVARACARLSTRAGYAAYQEKASDPQMPKLASQLCKKDPEAIRAKLCKQAAAEAKGDDTPKDTLDFLAGNCPDETKLLAKKVCAGRKFTGLPENIRPICVQYAREQLGKDNVQPASDEQPAEDEAPKKTPKDQATEGAKKLLKGLFGK